MRKRVSILVIMTLAAALFAVPALALSLDDAEGYFDCTKKGKTVYLYIEKTPYEDLGASFTNDNGDELFIGAGDFDGKTIKAYDGDDYYVTLTFQGEDTVKVKAGKRVKANIGTALDGTYKRHYGK